MKRTKSDKVLTTPEAMISVVELIHLPGIEGSQIFSRGMHWRMADVMQVT